ncbi:hypothetical protein BDR22DRAFT_843759 [Usnea florida]
MSSLTTSRQYSTARATTRFRYIIVPKLHARRQMPEHRTVVSRKWALHPRRRIHTSGSTTSKVGSRVLSAQTSMGKR